MAKPSELRARIDALLDEYMPLIREAFLLSIVDVTSQITLKLVVERLERQDVGGALDALNLERAAFSRVETAIATAYNAGGTAMVGHMPTLRDANGAKIIVRFDARNLRAEEWLRSHSANLVTRIVADQRTDLRSALERGMAAGRNPNSVALDIVGRVNRVTKRREGGLIGLTSPQIEQLAEVQRILANPDEIRKFFIKDAATGKWKPRYKTTPRRWDNQILKAINEGRGLSLADISRISTVHSNNLLALRGKMLARSEALASIHAGKYEGFVQGLGKTNYPPEAVTRTWRTAGDVKVRHSHAPMNGQVVVGLATPFMSAAGALMMHPGDTSMGAGADEVAGCRCDDDYSIDFSWGVT